MIVIGHPVPGEEHVFGAELVAVGERDVLLQLDGVGETVRRDATVAGGGNRGGDVRDDRQRVVKPPKVVEDVLHELAVDLGVKDVGVPGLRILEHWEVQDLRFGEPSPASATRCAAAAGNHEDAQGGNQHTREFSLG